MENRAMNSTTVYELIASPLGPMRLTATPDGLASIFFTDETGMPPRDTHWVRDPASPVLRRAAVELGEYFAGRRRAFDLPLAPSGTPFQLDVWKAISTVRAGETISYAELARRSGHPGSFRAVGAATGRNPLAIVVPCHRIVGSDGSLTGYAGGLPRKRALLALEGESRAQLALPV
jgi:methylated-DNA-[protein]-cysteine S-methyltransferase